MSNLNKKFKVVGLGEILWDMLPDGKQLGGAPANFAFHAQSLGAESFVVSSVGNDALGTELLDLLSELNLYKDYIAIDSTHPTGTVSVKLDEHGTPDFAIHEEVAWDYISLTPELERFVQKVDAVCFGSLAQRYQRSRSTIDSLLHMANPDCIKVFDVNLRQHFYKKDVIVKLLNHSNILKLNDDELPIVAHICSVDGDENTILKKLFYKFDLNLIALTKGGNGSRLFSQDYDAELPVERIEIADTVGAGDAFTAALIMGLLHGLPTPIVHRNAVELASYVCTQNGATPQLGLELKKKLLDYQNKG